MAIYSGFTHQKLLFSIAMLVYQRVSLVKLHLALVPVMASAEASNLPRRHDRSDLDGLSVLATKGIVSDGVSKNGRLLPGKKHLSYSML